MGHPLKEYPLDGVDLDTRVNDVLGVPGVASYKPDDGPGIRYCKFIPLDDDKSRMLEFFVESCVNKMPKNMIEGYSLDDVRMTSGVMMRRVVGQTPDGRWKTVGLHIPADQFIDEYLTDTTVKIRAYRWFAENSARAAMDEETLESLNASFLPELQMISVPSTKSPFRTKKDLH